MRGLLLLWACGAAPPAPEDMVRIADDDAPFWIDPYEFPNEPGTKPLTYTDLTEAQQACAS